MSNVLSEKPYVSERDPGRKVPKKITKKNAHSGLRGSVSTLASQTDSKNSCPYRGFAGAFRLQEKLPRKEIKEKRT